MSAREQAEQTRRRDMKTLADDLEGTVSGSVMAVFQGAGDIMATAGRMGTQVDQSTNRSMKVAEASERASHDIGAVAAAIEERSASIGEIRRQVAKSAEISSQAVAAAERTNDTVQGLANAADRIGDVVKLINNIASQTNLLALNATIEGRLVPVRPAKVSRSLRTR